jgi:hypothetical protein
MHINFIFSQKSARSSPQIPLYKQAPSHFKKAIAVKHYSVSLHTSNGDTAFIRSAKQFVFGGMSGFIVVRYIAIFFELLGLVCM